MKSDRGEDRPLSRNLGILLLAIVAVIWGSGWPINKIIVSEIVPLTSRAMILPFSAIVLLLSAHFSGHSLAVPRSRWPWLVLVSMFNISGFVLCVAYGIANMPAGRAVIIAYTMPLWASILGIFILGESMTLRRAVSLTLGMSGLAILVIDEITSLAGAPIGAAFVLGAALSWAIGTILMKRIDWQTHLLPLTGWQLTIGSLPILLGLPLVADTDFSAVSLVSYAGLLFMIVGSMSFCYVAFFKVLAIFPAGTAAIGTLLAPVIGVLGSALVIDEALGWRELSALFLVCTALALELRGAARKP